MERKQNLLKHYYSQNRYNMKRLKLFIGVLLLTLFFASCTKDEPKLEAASSVNENATRWIQSDDVNIDEVPDLESYISEKTGVDVKGESGKHNHITFDYTSIRRTTDSLQNKNYSIAFHIDGAEINEFYNLVIGVDKFGNKSKPVVIRYVANQSSIQTITDTGELFPNFRGSIGLHKYTDFFHSHAFGKDCPPEFDEFGDPIACEIENIPDGGSGGAGSGGSGSGGSSGGGSSGGGTGTGGGSAGINISCVCKGHSSREISEGDCDCDDFVIEIIVNGIDKSAVAKNNCEDCSGGSGAAGINPSMLARIQSITNKLNGIVGLNFPQKRFLISQENWAFTEQLNVYQRETYNNTQRNNFIKGAINTMINGTPKEKLFVVSVLNEDYGTVVEMLTSDATNGPVDCCSFNPDCCENGDYFDAPVQFTVNIALGIGDGIYNLYKFVIETETSKRSRGKTIREIWKNQGVPVPADIDDFTLGTLFKVRARNWDVTIEPANEYGQDLADVGISVLDILGIASPSRSAASLLFIKGTGNITAKMMSDYLKQVATTAAKVDGLINKLAGDAKYSLQGTGTYRQVNGHHPLSKQAFLKDRGYYYRDAFSVSIAKLKSVWRAANPNADLIDVHAKITGRQNSLYSAHAIKGEGLNLEDMADIEIQAMVDVGIPEDIATGWVIKALQDLKTQNVATITHIPWNGAN